MCGSIWMWAICKVCAIWLHHCWSYSTMSRWATAVSAVWWSEWSRISQAAAQWICIWPICVRWYKFWTRKCTIWCTPMAIIRIFISAIAGSCWISNVKWFTRTSSSHGKRYGQPSMWHRHISYYSLHWHCSKHIVTSSYWTAWTLPMSSNFSMVNNGRIQRLTFIAHRLDRMRNPLFCFLFHLEYRNGRTS